MQRVTNLFPAIVRGNSPGNKPFVAPFKRSVPAINPALDKAVFLINERLFMSFKILSIGPSKIDYSLI
jgi:hypothetical protein